MSQILRWKLFMMQKNDKYINQFGRSMVEMIGVLTIVGVLSIGGIAG